MKLGTLLRIEFIKTVKRRAFWVSLGFLVLICTVTIVGELLTGRRGMGAPFVAPFTWAVIPLPEIVPVPVSETSGLSKS